MSAVAQSIGLIDANWFLLSATHMQTLLVSLLCFCGHCTRTVPGVAGGRKKCVVHVIIYYQSVIDVGVNMISDCHTYLVFKFGLSYGWLHCLGCSFGAYCVMHAPSHRILFTLIDWLPCHNGLLKTKLKTVLTAFLSGQKLSNHGIVKHSVTCCL